MFVSYKDRIIYSGQRVHVYRNLNKPGVTYSIRSAKTGLVLGHMDHLLLINCDFIISKPGQEKVRRTKKKSVHAWIEGTYSKLQEWTDRYYGDGAVIKYNPYIHDYFVDGASVPVHKALVVYIKDGNVWAH